MNRGQRAKEEGSLMIYEKVSKITKRDPGHTGLHLQRHVPGHQH